VRRHQVPRRRRARKATGDDAPAPPAGDAESPSSPAPALSAPWRRALHTDGSSRRLAGDARRNPTGDDTRERQRCPWTEDAIRGKGRRSLERAYRLLESSIVEAGERAREIAELVQSGRHGGDRGSGQP